MASVTLSFTQGFTTSTYTIRCNSVQIGWRNNVVAKANANGEEVVSAQTQGFENPTYVLQGVYFTDETSTLTYDALLSMAKNKNSSVNFLTLNINHAVNYTSSTAVLPDSAGATSGIKVVIDSFNFNYDVTSFVTYPPVGMSTPTYKDHILKGTITLRETA